MKAVAGFALVSLLATASGCRTTVQAGQVLTPTGERLIRDNQPRAPLEVVVPVGPAQGAAAELVRVAADQAFLRVSGGEVSVPAAAIRRVEVTDGAAGAIEGVGGGILVGAALGAMLGAQYDGSTFSRTSAMVWSGAILGILGGLAGLIVGGVRGDVTTYRFE